jgi:hypothetical protein
MVNGRDLEIAAALSALAAGQLWGLPVRTVLVSVFINSTQHAA